MRLGVTNGIIDDSDFKPSEFDRWLQYKSDSKDNFESTIAIMIKFWSIFEKKLSNFDWIQPIID